MPPAPVLSRPDTSGVSEAWLRGIPHDPNNADWSSYDSDIATITRAYNDHLSGQSGFFPLDPTFVKAMCWTESGAAAPEWTSRPMQIGNNANVEEYTQKINYCLWVLNGGAVAADAAGKAGSK